MFLTLEKLPGKCPLGILFVFSEYACLDRHLTEESAGRCELLLCREDTGLAEDVTLVLLQKEDGWLIGEKKLTGEGPFYFYTEKKEKLLLLLAPKPDILHPTEKLHMKIDEVLKIGSAFRNQIFYECFSLTGQCHAQIGYEEQGFVLSGLEDKGSGSGDKGIYVNGQALRGKKILQTGDEVQIYALRLLVLEETIVCASFAGICRMAKGRGSEWVKKQIFSGTGKAERGRSLIERRCATEERLCSGEVEIILPEKPAAEQEQPLWLSLGPSVTMVLPMLLMAELGSRYMGNGGGGFYYLSVAMSGCSALLAVLWGLAGHGYRKRTGKRMTREKERQYREYLEETEQYLLACQNKNRSILLQKYPSVSAFLEEGEMALKVLWDRYYRQRDFLFLRLGEGDIPFQMEIKLSENRRNIVERKQAVWARELAEKYLLLKQVPVGIDFREHGQLGVVCGSARGEMCEMLLALLIQTAACHCYTEVKIACFYRKERFADKRLAECLKWLPHVWTAGREVRLLAGDEKEAGEVLPALTKALTREGQTGDAGDRNRDKGISLPWYLVLVLDPELIWSEPLYQYLTEDDIFRRAGAVFVGENREQLPKSCRCFLSRDGKKGDILYLGEEKMRRQTFVPELCPEKRARQYARRTSGFRVREAAGNGQLPKQVGFLDLFGCGRVEELCSGRRWIHAKTGERLKAPVGFGAGGNLISLDIHEKFHGPHGLVAGTTGSGKSELLQTYLLSMAVSYSPADVNFFMIDYKGGGTGNLLKHLPHCAGVISNLSGKQIGRAMSAIISENKRRQKLLGSAQVNHIDAYTRLYHEGAVTQAMPHLLLVVDEFAELKKEEPEFMQEIISLAQVGRSLGMHLILATQKPAGTVDDKIWSNARFRLCLRVQDVQDSMDMLHNRDAAYLTAPGQCYLQIGNQEYYELFQAGYCGGNYREKEKEQRRAALVSNTGRRLERTEEKTGEERSQMEVLTEYIIRTAESCGYSQAAALWLPELPKKIFFRDLPGKKPETKGALEQKKPGREPVLNLGLCDDPENQRRFVLTYEPVTQGHLALCAGPATGKTFFLQTLLWQLCESYEPWEVQILAVDIGQENLGDFCAMPHCLGVLKNKEGKDIFFYHLERLMEERKTRLSGLSCFQYNKSRKGKMPYLFLTVDNFGELKKIWEEKQEELFLKLAAEGLTLGIYLVLSASGAGEIGGRLFEKFRTTLAFEMSDRFQYGDVLRQYYLPVLPEENCKGRGLCRSDGRVLEFQAAMIGEGQEDYAYSGQIQSYGIKRTQETAEQGGEAPEKFPVLPRQVSFEGLAEDFDWNQGRIPLGYSLSTGEIRGISPKQAVCFLISGKERTGRSAVLSCMVEGTLRLGGQAVVLEEEKSPAHFQDEPGVIYLRNETEAEDWRMACEKSGLGEKDGSKISVFIGNMGHFCRFLYGNNSQREERIRFWEDAAMGKGAVGFLAGIYHPERDYEAAETGFFREFIAWQQGIHLGGNAAGQRALSFDDLSYAGQNQWEAPGTGYLKEGPGSSTCRLRLPAGPAGKDRKACFDGGDTKGREY